MSLTPSEEQQILKKSSLSAEHVFSQYDVHAFYPSTKLVDGHDTQQPCMTMCVSKKIASNWLCDDKRIPRLVGDGVITDVIELPPIHAQAWCGSNTETLPRTLNPTGCENHVYDPSGELYRDLPGGVSCGPSMEMEPGTLGVMVKDRGSRRVVGLTCNHVGGLQPYFPGPQHGVKRYVVSDDGYNFVITDPDTDLSYTKPGFDDVQFPRLQAGNIYEFQIETTLHDFYISEHPAGAGFKPWTTVTISNSAGEVRYSNGQGTGTPAASAGEFLTFVNDPNQAADTLYYNSWLYPWLGDQFQYVFAGVPPCKSLNYDRGGPGITEYTDGRLKTPNRDITGGKVAYPSNLDYNNSGQSLLGAVSKTQSIYFQHPLNRTQPKNTIDAATIDLNSERVQGKFEIVGLTRQPLRAAHAVVGARVFKSGRTTGVTPSGASITTSDRVGGSFTDCVITSTTATINVNYCGAEQTIQKMAIFEDCVLYSTTGEYFSDVGDSGAALLMEDVNDGGRLKLVGLHFSGGYNHQPLTSYGVACKIQNVFNTLDLTTWEGTIVVPDDSPCIKVDGLCYERREVAYVRPTHTNVDETFDECEDCTND